MEYALQIERVSLYKVQFEQKIKNILRNFTPTTASFAVSPVSLGRSQNATHERSESFSHTAFPLDEMKTLFRKTGASLIIVISIQDGHNSKNAFFKESQFSASITR
ncbi:hypothetical protein AVEN_130242-1 [Araneus ventricosus]|uniref:Uncharacterized protein n=1 Tax=Araneus ventricosus TaxID=182803 RepID=A0A4Y2V984_ARAVE|nr:hypothetical protein AVEN_130242-1 [Araneus ventricosus]